MTRGVPKPESKAGLCPDPQRAGGPLIPFLRKGNSKGPADGCVQRRSLRPSFLPCLAALLLAAPLLAGCGFHPLYGSGGASAQAQGGPVSAQLDGIYVELIPNRLGQLLRQALQARLDTDDGNAKAYSLAVAYSIDEEPISVLTTNSNTRTRAIGRGTWVLTAIAAPGAPLASGTVRVLDGFNPLDQQVFFSVLENEAVQRRLADNIADQITQRLATYFRRST